MPIVVDNRKTSGNVIVKRGPSNSRVHSANNGQSQKRLFLTTLTSDFRDRVPTNSPNLTNAVLDFKETVHEQNRALESLIKQNETLIKQNETLNKNLVGALTLISEAINNVGGTIGSQFKECENRVENLKKAQNEFHLPDDEDVDPRR